jgi:hypothetical protein
MLSPGRGPTPAETGVDGRVETLGDGRGKEAELSRASRDLNSSAEGLVGGASDPRGFVTVVTGTAERGVLGRVPSGLFASGALDILPSLVLLDRELVDDTVFALVGGFATSATSIAGSVKARGWGFRACATANGPAH